ncbi:protein of unknown function [Burkholderia multivorans]
MATADSAGRGLSGLRLAQPDPLPSLKARRRQGPISDV